MSSSSFYELILTTSPHGPIMAYQTSGDTTITHFSGSRSPRRGITMAGQGLIVASHVSSDTGTGSINTYNWYSSTVFQNFPVTEPIAPLVATLDGAFLFAGGISGSIHSLSVPSGDVIKSFSVHSKPVSCLLLNNDGSLVISSSDDGTIGLIPTFKIIAQSCSSSKDSKDLILHKWKAHSDSVTALKYESGALVSCSMDYTCKFWDLMDDGAFLKRTVAFPCVIFGFVMDSIESRFFAAGADGLVYKGLMKVGSRKLLSGAYELKTWSKRHDGSIVNLVLVNGGRNLVSATEEGDVWMWDIEKGEVTMVFENKMGISISDMIVVRSTVEFGVRRGTNASDSGFVTSSELCDEMMTKTLKQIAELGEVMDVIVEDKKKAIDMLESAIDMYQRLLKLILKEATKAIEEEDKNDLEEGKDDDDEIEHHE